ncbi:unnamed protein product, partial [Amoebophrya sp. A120]
GGRARHGEKHDGVAGGRRRHVVAPSAQLQLYIVIRYRSALAISVLHILARLRHALLQYVKILLLLPIKFKNCNASAPPAHVVAPRFLLELAPCFSSPRSSS